MFSPPLRRPWRRLLLVDGRMVEVTLRSAYTHTQRQTALTQLQCMKKKERGMSMCGGGARRRGG